MKRAPLVVALVWTAFLPCAAQDHPAFTPPSGFASASEGQERVFTRTAPNGDRLRIHVLLQPGATDADAVASGPALGEGDQVRAETRQDIAAGRLKGVGYSVAGRSETIDGIAYTRYRRAIGLAIEGNPVAFAVRADILAKEPKPAASTLDAMGRALTEWQQRMGGVATEPGPAPGADPTSRPLVGGEQVVRLTGGGDLEIQVPAFWGRADLVHAPGHQEILLGPARAVLEKATLETIAKDKDRIGPYVSITRIQKETFADLVDVQLLDIQETLLADYVARMAEVGVTLTLASERDEGLLGTRTVISVPFEETRASGTRHRGRSVFMMHRGSLVIVTASHPVEKFDEGWPDIAKAFDTLLFTGAAESEPGTERPDPGPSADAPGPPPAEPGGPTGPPAPFDPTRAAPPEWTAAPSGALKAVRIPLATPVSMSIPAAWTLRGSLAPARAANAFFATPGAEGAIDPLASSVRVDDFPFLEELLAEDALARLSALVRLRLELDARALGHELEVSSTQDASVAGRRGTAAQYRLRTKDRAVSGTIVGVALDGAAVVVDLRVASTDDGWLLPECGRILESIAIDAKDDAAIREFGPYRVLAPASWEASDEENQGGGRNVFLRASSGVDLRFQTAVQRRQEVVDVSILRRVSTGFLVEGLKVLTLEDMATAGRHLATGGGPALRFEARKPEVDVLVLATMQGEHLVFTLLGVPPGYRGHDLAVAWRAIRSFAVAGAGVPRARDPVRIAGEAVAARTVFARTELDGIEPGGAAGEPSSLSIALLPEGTAEVVAIRRGKHDSVPGTYRIEGGQVAVEGPGLGRMIYRLSDDGETLVGVAPGDVLFRARREETP